MPLETRNGEGDMFIMDSVTAIRRPNIPKYLKFKRIIQLCQVLGGKGKNNRSC